MVTTDPGASEKTFENVDDRRQVTDPVYLISSTGAFSSWELKNKYRGKKKLAGKLGPQRSCLKKFMTDVRQQTLFVL